MHTPGIVSAAALLVLSCGAATGALAQPLRYSSFLDGPAAIGAGAGAIVSAAQEPRAGRGLDVRVVKFDAATHAVVWSAVIGGSANDWPASVAVAADGSVWVSGTTTSADFPLVQPIQTWSAGPAQAAFLFHLDATGNTVLSSTVFAVAAGSVGGGDTVRIAPGGTVVWVGQTFGGTVPTTAGVFQPLPGSVGDLFLATFEADGALRAATYVGGNGNESGGRIDVGVDGAVYLAGTTASTNLPATSGAFQTTPGARSCPGRAIVFTCTDGFVARIGSDLGHLDDLTYLRETAGVGFESIGGIALGPGGDLFVAGTTTSGNGFPTTPGVFQRQCESCTRSDVFVARLNSTRSALVYSTFLSGSLSAPGQADVAPFNTARAIAVDGAGRAYVLGETSAVDFPVAAAYQSEIHSFQDVFLARLNAAGTRLEVSTYLGGHEEATGGEEATSVLLTDGGGTVWLSGSTASSDFPLTPDAYKTTRTAQHVGFLTAFTLSSSLLSIDEPAAGNVTAPFNIGGWAIDQGAATDSGIDAVHVWAYPNPGSGAAPIFLGAAGLDYARSDIGSIFGAQFANAGWAMTVDTLAQGRYLLAVFGHSELSGTFDVVSTRLITVVVEAPPILTIDVPSEGANATSPLFIGGWSIDRRALTGTGIDAIHVWAYPNPGSGAAPIFLGVATYGIARGDVGAIFGARFTPSGYELRPAMTPGTYGLAVFAHSTVTRTFVVVQTRIVTVK